MTSDTITDTCGSCGAEDVKVFVLGDGQKWCSGCIESVTAAPAEALQLIETFTQNVNFGA